MMDEFVAFLFGLFSTIRYSIKHWRKHGGAPPEGVGQAVGQAAAIIRKATERRRGGFAGAGRFGSGPGGAPGGPPGQGGMSANRGQQAGGLNSIYGNGGDSGGFGRGAGFGGGGRGGFPGQQQFGGPQAGLGFQGGRGPPPPGAGYGQPPPGQYGPR